MLAERGAVELFFGERGGEMGLVLPADLRDIVLVPDSWWSPVEGTTPETELFLTPQAGPVPLPQRRA